MFKTAAPRAAVSRYLWRPWGGVQTPPARRWLKSRIMVYLHCIRTELSRKLSWILTDIFPFSLSISHPYSINQQFQIACYVWAHLFNTKGTGHIQINDKHFTSSTLQNVSRKNACSADKPATVSSRNIVVHTISLYYLQRLSQSALDASEPLSLMRQWVRY